MKQHGSGTGHGSPPKDEPRAFIIKLVAQPSVENPTLSLKAALKRFSRCYGLRCVGISPAPEKPEGAK